jgi:hypothetical protein
VSHDEVPQKLKQQIVTQWFILTVLWEIDEFHAIDLMTGQHTYKTQSFLRTVMEPLLLATFPDGWKAILAGLVCILKALAFAAQWPLMPLSPKITLFECPIRYAVLT